MDEIKKIREERSAALARIDSFWQRMCDDYCKYPGEIKDVDALDNICSECPLNELMSDKAEVFAKGKTTSVAVASRMFGIANRLDEIVDDIRYLEGMVEEGWL